MSIYTRSSYINKYHKWYCDIIYQRINNPSTASYTETHHIVPRSLGGSNTSENLVPQLMSSLVNH